MRWGATLVPALRGRDLNSGRGAPPTRGQPVSQDPEVRMTWRVGGECDPLSSSFGDTRACATRACGWRARVLDRRVRVAGFVAALFLALGDRAQSPRDLGPSSTSGPRSRGRFQLSRFAVPAIVLSLGLRPNRGRRRSQCDHQIAPPFFPHTVVSFLIPMLCGVFLRARAAQWDARCGPVATAVPFDAATRGEPDGRCAPPSPAEPRCFVWQMQRINHAPRKAFADVVYFPFPSSVRRSTRVMTLGHDLRS